MTENIFYSKSYILDNGGCTDELYLYTEDKAWFWSEWFF